MPCPPLVAGDKVGLQWPPAPTRVEKEKNAVWVNKSPRQRSRLLRLWGATQPFKTGELHVYAKIRITVILASLHRWHRRAMAGLAAATRPRPVRLDLRHERLGQAHEHLRLRRHDAAPPLPDFLGYVAPFVEFIGGVLVIAGLATRYASLLMLLFIIIAAFSSHRYWAAEPAQVVNQSTHFWKAVTMMGGAVLLF